MANMFYVHPGNDRSQGLSGIGNVLQNIGEEKRIRDEEEKQRIAYEQSVIEADEALRSGDFETIQSVALRNPHLSESIWKGYGVKTERDKQDVIAINRDIVTSGNPIQAIEKKIAGLNALGQDSTMWQEELMEAQQDPEGYTRMSTMAFAGMAPKEYEAWRDSTATPEEKDVTASAVTKILPNGTTIQALSDGRTVVKDATGTELTGDARVKAIKEAQDSELAFERAKFGERAAGSAAIDMSAKTFEQIAPIKRSISNIDNAIAAIDKGAATGPVISQLPSIRAASVELDNIQKAMGLDVISETTFGALSEGELKLALNKALPTNLSPADLRRWLEEKKIAQEKLVSYLENAAIYLGIPGNTISGFLSEQKEMAKLGQQESAPQSGRFIIEVVE